MAKATPVQQMRNAHGSKDKLIDSATKALKEVGVEVDDISSISNSRLLHLIDVASRVKSDFGSKDKLVAAVAESKGLGKDSSYAEKLGDYSLPRLLDLATSAARQAKNAKKKAA